MKTCVFGHKELFALYPVTVGVKHLQERICRTDGCWFDQIFAVCGGEGIFEAGGEQYRLESGDLFFVEKNVPHSYRGNSGFTTSYFGFDGDYRKKLYEYFNVSGYGVYKGKNSRRLLGLLESFYNEFESITDSALLCAKAYELVGVFFATAKEDECGEIDRVKSFLEANYASALALSDILEFYPYSKAKLCRDFRQAFGKTVFEMLTEIRLEHSSIMLCDPQAKLSDVAHNSGFNDVSYFCRTYKKHYKKSPRSKNNSLT